MLIGTVLFAAGLAVAGCYFILFRKIMKASPRETEKYVEAFLGKRKLDWIVPVLALVALLVRDLTYSLSFFAAAIAFGAVSMIHQNRRMKELGFSDSFRLQLFRASTLVPVAIALFLAGQIWRGS